MRKSKKVKELSREFWISLISVCSLMTLLITIAFIVFVNRAPDVVEKKETGGYVTLNYTTATSALAITNATPTTDAVGMKKNEAGQFFDFSVDVNLEDAKKVEYEISVIRDEKNCTINDEDVRIYLEKEDSGTYTQIFGPEKFKPMKNYSSVGSEIGSMVLTNVKKIKAGTDNYRLRLWLSDKAIASGGNYSVEVDIHAIAK